MSAQFAHTPSFSDEQYQETLALKNKRFGLVLWRIANGMVFAFFALANYLIRQSEGTWPPAGVSRLDAGIPTLITLALIASSLPALRLQAAARREDQRGMLVNIAATVGLGLVFLIGLVFVWGRVPYSGSYSSIFYVMTAFHALHVIVGLLLLLYVFLKARRGVYTRDNHWSLEAAVVFWHFVDLMWLVFFAVLYVL